jgi:hypothetical protein
VQVKQAETRGSMLTRYKVTAVNRYGHSLTGTVVVKGSAQIRAAKAQMRGKLNKKRQKFDVYNENKKKLVNV